MAANIYLVLGSSPDLLFPPPAMKFAEVYCANGALRIAADAGFTGCTLFTHAGFPTMELTAHHERLFGMWRHQGAKRAYVDETDGTTEGMIPFFHQLDMDIPDVVPVSYQERGAIVSLVLGRNLGMGSAYTRVSTGVFAACMALHNGADHVVLAGFSLGAGHYGTLAEHPRYHLLGDVEAFRILAKKGKSSTTSPILAETFGFPLLVAKGNEQRVAYLQSKATWQDAEACLQAAFDLLGQPARLVDIGSGAGHLVTFATMLGVRATGLDLYPAAPGAKGAFYKWDLGQPWPGGWGDGADMVLCWETAEHVAPEGADALCANARRALAAGGFLLFSAATPGQGGSGHVNEQPHDYWAAKFAALGLLYAPHLTAKLRSDFKRVAPRAWWYGKNLLVFEAPKGGQS